MPVSPFGDEPTVKISPFGDKPTAQDTSFLGDVGTALSKRGSEIGKIVTGGYKDQGIGHDIAQVAGEVGGGIGDVMLEGVTHGLDALDYNDTIENKIKEAFAGSGDAIMQSEAGQSFAGALQGGVENVEAWAKDNPAWARTLSGALNLPLLTALKPMAKGAKEVYKGATRYTRGAEPVTYDSVKQATTNAYNIANESAEKTGTMIKTGNVKNRFNFNVKKAQGKVGGAIDPRVHKKAVEGLAVARDALKAKNVTPLHIENTRGLLNDIIKDSRRLGVAGMEDTPTTVKLYDIKDAFDNAVDAIDAKDLSKGNPEFLANYKEARRVNTIKQKLKPIDKIFRDAKLNKKNTSFELSLKNGFNNLAKNDRKMKPYSAEERFLIEKAATTGNVEGILNKMGVFSPTSGKLGMAMTGGGGAGMLASGAVNPFLLALPVAGFAAKAGSDKMARDAAKQAMQGIAGKVAPQAPTGFRLMQQDLQNIGKPVKDIVGGQRGSLKLGDDLPMDTQSRMQRARDMGANLDEPLYHGTDSDIKAFNPKLSNTSAQTGVPDGMTVLSNNPEVANTYAMAASKNREVREAVKIRDKLLADKGKAFLEHGENSQQFKKSVFNLDKAQVEIDKAWAKVDSGENTVSGANIIKAYSLAKKPLNVEAKGRMTADLFWNDITVDLPNGDTFRGNINDLARLAKKQGFDSLAVDNVVDSAGDYYTPSKTVFIFDNKNIRSTHAKFNPKDAGKAGLTLGAGGIMINEEGTQ